MINMALGIHPYQATTAAWRRGSISLSGAGGGLRSGLAVAFGLNRFPIFESGLAGDADAAGLAAGETSAFLCPRVFAAEGEASGLAAGAGDVSAFLRPRVFAGDAEASGLAAGAGDVSAFL